MKMSQEFGYCMERLILIIADSALRAANDGISGDVELRGEHKFVDARLGGLVAAVNAERVAAFPSGRLFLDALSRPLRWRWSMIMRSGAHHRGSIEAG